MKPAIIIAIAFIISGAAIIGAIVAIQGIVINQAQQALDEYQQKVSSLETIEKEKQQITKEPSQSTITNFEECIAAGNPAMESYPRQCRTPDGKHFVESIPEHKKCEMTGGLWGIWGNAQSAKESCNPSTSDGGMECSDSSQCQSFCQAKEGSEINSESIGMCYGYELAICLQEVQNGVVQNEWCQ